MRKTFIGLAFMALAGCTYMPISSMLKLRQFDLMTADARQIQVAVQFPDVMEVREDGAEMIITVEHAELGEKLEERFVLERVSGVSATPGVERRPGTHLEVFRMAEADMDRLAAMRRRLAAWKAADPDSTKGSLSVGAAGCRRDSLPDGPLIISTYLRLEDADEFFPLTRNFNLRSFASGPQLEIACHPANPDPESPRRE